MPAAESCWAVAASTTWSSFSSGAFAHARAWLGVRRSSRITRQPQPRKPHEGLVLLGLLQRVQVSTLQVLDDADLGRLDLLERAHDGWHALQPGILAGGDAAVAGDDAVLPYRLVAIRPQQHRLEDAVGAHALHQVAVVLVGVRVEGAPRLNRARSGDG